MKLLEVALKAKDRVESWAAVERERLDDMMAEARSNIARSEATAKPGQQTKSAGKRRSRLVGFETEPKESVV